MENNETTENTNTCQQQCVTSYTGGLDNENSANEKKVVDPCGNDKNDVDSTMHFIDCQTVEHTADLSRLQDQPQFCTAVDLSLNANSESKTNDENTISHTKESTAPNTNFNQFPNRHHQPSAVKAWSLNSKLQSNTNDEVVYQPGKMKRKQNFNQLSRNHQPYAAVDLSSNSNIKSIINDNIVVPYSNRLTSTSNIHQPQEYYQHRQDSWLHSNENSYKKKRYNSYYRKSSHSSSTSHRNFKNSDRLKNAGDLEKLNKMTAKDFDDDRYARFGIHESEIKDYIRTISYKSCIEHCAENHFKVNINFIHI